MKLELENHGERRTVEVDSKGRVYVGTEYADTTVELAFEVVEDES
jgi:tRNA(Phe) wybutosine-synthesizing methylase Tyw3